MKWLTLILLLLPSLAKADLVRVQSGEHVGFSRLVFKIGTKATWKFGRTAQGYELHLTGAGAGFDLAHVYDLMKHDRVADIVPGSKVGVLAIRLGCACHAQPYEFQPGVLVIDVRNGPAPAGSAFELALDGSQLGPIELGAVPPASLAEGAKPEAIADGQAEPRPGYDWTLAAAAGAAPEAKGGVVPELALNAALRAEGSTAVLRKDLLNQLAEGAARGVITLDLPEGQTVPKGIEPAQNLRVGEDLGLVVLPGGQGDDIRARTNAEGVLCPKDEHFDLATWGGDASASSALGPMVMTGLIGEFDRTDTAALLRAVRYLLYLGFGAEARQMLSAFDDPLPDRDILLAMSYAVDGEVPPQPTFAPMAGCDATAALWAALTTSDLTQLRDLNGAAVSRSFSNLPVTQRRMLGPVLTERLLKAGKLDLARAVTDAMQRAPGPRAAAVELAGAEVEIALGTTGKATATLETLSKENTAVTPDALIALVEARITARAPVDPDRIATIEALIHEYRSTPEEQGLTRALVLAKASVGEFDAAFAVSARLGPTPPDVWALLAETGVDDAFLTHAVLPVPEPAPDLPRALRFQIAARLVGLGLPDPALHWLQDLSDPTPDESLIIAQAQAARRDGLAVLRALQGVPGEVAARLRAETLAALGQNASASAGYAALGDTAALARSERQMRDWPAVAEAEDHAWAQAAGLLAPAAPSDLPGPLARGKALVSESTTARQSIEALLAAAPMPPVEILEDANGLATDGP